MQHLFRLVIALVLCFGASLAGAEVPVPPLSARVTDLTGTLDSAQRNQLEESLRAFEARNGAQLAVLLVPTTQPETIEQYSLRVAEAWKLGQKGKDNGLLVVVAKNDRKLRIEVGYGLEGDIPDAVARRVIDETISPRFKQGDFAGGLAAGTQRLIGLVEHTAGTEQPSEARARNNRPETALDRILDSDDLPGYLIAAIVGGFVVRSLFGRLFGSTFIGLGMGIVTWLITAALGNAVFFGLVSFALMYILTSRTFMNSRGSRHSNWGSGDWGGGDWGGGGWSSGSSGGGFSGGGGSFGGGGSYGSW